jgi:hypothetical protein
MTLRPIATTNRLANLEDRPQLGQRVLRRRGGRPVGWGQRVDWRDPPASLAADPEVVVARAEEDLEELAAEQHLG